MFCWKFSNKWKRSCQRWKTTFTDCPVSSHVSKQFLAVLECQSVRSLRDYEILPQPTRLTLHSIKWLLVLICKTFHCNLRYFFLFLALACLSKRKKNLRMILLRKRKIQKYQIQRLLLLKRTRKIIITCLKLLSTLPFLNLNMFPIHPYNLRNSCIDPFISFCPSFLKCK